MPTAPKIRQIREGAGERQMTILSGLGGLYAPFDLEAGSDGFNTGFAFPEVLQALVAAPAGRLAARPSYLRAVCRPPGVRAATRRCRAQGAAAPARRARFGAREAPGRSLPATQAAQLDALLARTLPGVDITRPIASDTARCRAVTECFPDGRRRACACALQIGDGVASTTSKSDAWSRPGSPPPYGRARLSS